MRDADEVVMVDLTPALLLNRLLRGVIYSADKAQKAMDHFFKESDVESRCANWPWRGDGLRNWRERASPWRWRAARRICRQLRPRRWRASTAILVSTSPQTTLRRCCGGDRRMRGLLAGRLQLAVHISGGEQPGEEESDEVARITSTLRATCISITRR